MTKDEALKLALEALENHTVQTRPIAATEAAITATKAALAQPEQEPVGHIYTIAGVQHCTIEQVLPDGPLYTNPPPCPTCEALSRTVMLDQTSHDRHKREWVGLTDVEWEAMYDQFAEHQPYGAFVSGWGKFANAIEAKLKEKNT